MHSSRMRTGRSLTVCRRSATRGGGCVLPGGCMLHGGGRCVLHDGGGCMLPGEGGVRASP